MPSLTENIRINDPFMDRRTRLLPCQKEMVHYWHSRGSSIHSISKLFHVNKRLIQFELFPERKLRNIQLRQDRVGTNGYYNKAEHTIAMRDHRKYKSKLFGK